MGATVRTNQGTIVWVGCYPAHYTRVIHRALKSEFPGEIAFIYTRAFPERTYERDDIPEDAIILKRGSPWEVHRLLSELKPRAIIVAGHYPWPLFYAALWGFIYRREVLYYADTNLIDVLSQNSRLLWLRWAIFKEYFRRMHRLLYPGARTRDYYIWVCGGMLAKTKLCWLPYATLDSELASRKKANDKLRVLFVGRLAPEKAVDRLIEAFSLLSPECRAATCLHIGGDGPERYSLEQLVREHSLEDVVEFLGAVPSDRTVQLFSEASVFVLPSHREPWGVVVGQAMAAELPVIAPFWVGAVADLVVDGHSGIVMNDNSPEEIARAIEYFIHNPAETERMGKAAREVIENSKLTLDSVANVFCNITDGLKSKSLVSGCGAHHCRWWLR